jgi:hypothetical protein
VLTRVAPPRRLPRALARAGVCLGLGAVVVGTFLPWLHSGRTTRNSYATDGAVRRLLDVTGALDAALRIWPFVSLLCALAVALVLVGLPRAGVGLASVAAVCAGAVAAWALFSSGHGLIRPATAGPAVTLAGAILTFLAVLACASPFHRLIGRGPS